jgi:hypothetical protein
MENGPPKMVSGPIRAFGPTRGFFKKKAPALLLCIQKLDTQININYYKRQTHEKSLNNLSVFYYEDKTMRIQQTNQTVIWSNNNNQKIQATWLII